MSNAEDLSAANSNGERTHEHLVLSYLELRAAIGVLGVALPFVMLFGGFLFLDADAPVMTSISAYYWTGVGDVLVGMLCAIGIFLFAYQGYDKHDKYAGDLAFVMAWITAIVPTTPKVPETVNGPVPPEDYPYTVHAFEAFEGFALADIVHTVASALLFLTLAYFALVLFPKVRPGTQPDAGKAKRNRIYRTCGWIMIGSLVALVVVGLLPGDIHQWLRSVGAVFALESLTVLAFGVSWLVKGHAIKIGFGNA